MKGWRKPKAFAAAYSAQKRFLAFVLTLAMIFTSVGTDLNVSYAAQGNKVDFEIYGSDLVNAINEAVESDNVVKPDSLEFTNGAIDKFETLFYGEGKVYEVYPQIDGGDMDAELRVFVRLPEDADDMYMVTGDEEVIFLYVNNGDETISCATRIIRSVDGEEKVKTTKRINVKSYEDKFGDEEVDIVSKKDETVEETTASEEKSQDTATDAASEETTAAEEKETEITDETAEATEEETTEAAEENTEAETEEATEAEKETEAETEKETAEETEKETAEEKADAEGEVTASLSRHYAPVVAMKEDAQAEPEKETAEAAETEKEVVETEKETTEAVEKETAEAVETEKETTEAETKDTEVTETETAAETSETEETAEDASKEETAAESKENEETEETKETVAETSKAAETTAEAKEENKKADAATDSDLVGIGYCSTAKAYTTTVKALKALDDVQGLKVTYAINPEYSARIVDGQRGVEEGNDLVFGVKNQIGYAIETVTANGELLEADSTSDNEDGSVTAWYTVPEVTEEQEIEVYMTETDEHPEFNAELTMEDGTVITLHAAEGVLPAGVTAEATVKDDLADAVKEKLEAEDTDKGAVKAVVAYDINLMLNDSKLDNNWSQNGSVEVTFSGSKIQNMMSDAAVVEVYANKSSDEEALTTETTDDLNLEHILTEEITDSENENVTFEAKHFSEYIQVAREAKKTKSLNVIYHSNNKDFWWGSDVISKYSQKANAGDVITFPEYTEDKGILGDDWHFVGWSTDSQANEAGDGHYTQTVYRPGDTYRIPDDRQSDIDFYAIWAQKNVKANFYIRLDGTIPTEPQSHASSGYTAGITIEGALKSAAFYTNSTEGVGSQLAKRPTESQIRDRLRAKGINYNSETQYILWYVIKYENDGGTNYNWHVDGVLLDKEKVNLAYSPNCNTGEWVRGTMPDGSQYIKGTEATVSNNKIPERHGYTFVGWNTAADGTGTSYAPNDRFTINENTTLYAQWLEKGSVLLKYIANAGGSVSRGSESVAPATGNPLGSEATPASGYRFVNWTLGDTNTEVSRQNKLTKDFIDKYAKSVENLYVATTFKANFERDPEQAATVSYEFKYDKSGCEVGIPDAIKQAPTDNGTYYVGDTVTVKHPGTSDQIEDASNGGYWTLGSVWTLNEDSYAAGSTVTVTAANRQSLKFVAVWTFHPYEMICYEVAMGKGTVSRSSEKLNPTSGTALGSVATASTGYKFSGWYKDENCTDQVGSSPEFVPTVKTSATYYAKFEPKKDVSYTVHYYEEGTTNKVANDKIVNNQTFDATVEETAKDITGYTLVGNNKKTVTLDAYNKEITFYYKANTMSYTVKYLEKETNKVLHAELVKQNVKFGSKVTETAVDIPGYTVDGNKKVVEKLNYANNVITFYYTENQLVKIQYQVADGQNTMGSVTRPYEDVKPVTGTPVGSTANANEGYSFVNWTVNGVEVSKEQVLTPAVVAAYAKNSANVFEPTTFVANFQRKLVLKANDAKKTYDGKALTGTDAGYEIISGQLKDGDRLEVTYSGSQKDVGETVNHIVRAVVYRGEENVTSQYAFAPFKDGKLEVTPAIVTMQSASATKTYDGTPLTKTDEMVITGFADGEGVVCDDFASRTDVGDTFNTFKYHAASGTKLSNYDIKPENIQYGTLTVKPITTPIVVTASKLSKVYDGKPLTGETYAVSGDENLVAGDQLVVKLSGSITNVGTVTNQIAVCKVMRGNTDVTANYTIGTHDGTLTVMPRQITLTSATKQKPYDGQPLMDQTVTATAAEGTYAPFADGEGLVYNVTGSQLDEGSSANTFTYTAKEGTDLANYEITKVVGELTVTKNANQIVIVANSNSKKYDGTPLTDSGYTYTTGILADGDVLTATVEGTITNVGETANKVTGYVVKRGDQDVTKNYTFGESMPGKLEITKRDVTITSGSSKRAYNGQPLTNSETTVTGTGFVAGEEPTSYDVTGTITNVGEAANTFTYNLPANVSADNYDIKLVEGKLEITPVTAQIQITADSDSKVYNGTALVKNSATYTQGILAEGDRLETTVEGSQLGKGESANTVKSYKVLNAANEDVTGNYTFAESIPGKLTVTARPITITAASDSKKYDGTPLTANRYSVSENGLADSDEISEITIAGSQIEIGTSSNAVRADSVKITKKAEAANSRSAAEDVTGNYNIKLEEGILEVTNRNDLSYIVNYHYLDAKGKEVDVESVTKDDAFIGEAIAYSDAASRDHAGKTYALVRVDNAGKAVEYYADGAENPNVVDVYYGLDEIGTNTEKPKTPDGIPDMYQVVFRYISENPSYGTVDGAAVVDGYVMEVVTRPQKADGSYDMDAEVYPLGKVTVTGIGNYTFNHWSDSDTNYANANEIAGHGFKSDMTFVAHFSYDGGNNNNNNGGGNGGNGGGNGGSGSTSGGGSSSSGSRGAITVTSGGPGDQTVTIDAGDVPLAELPDAPVSPVEIDDGEVPLAALPKTGQTTMKLTITLMFSGIFLALTAMSKKHKEEES